jgi:dihydrolipoamide dehydrogenase
MPSKVMIQTGNDYQRLSLLVKKRIEKKPDPLFDDKEAMAHLRSLRDGFVKGMVKGYIEPLGNRFIDGYAEFIGPTLLQTNETKVRADRVIVATGTRPIIPQAWEPFTEHILTTDTIFEQFRLPQRIGVIGLGVIGLELGQALKRMGVNVTGFDTLERIAGLEDPDVNQNALKIFEKEFPIRLGTEARMESGGNQLLITAGDVAEQVDQVLVSVGRTPNVERLRLDRLGVDLDEKGLPPFSPETTQVADLPVFIAGDVNGYRPILHEAIHEGKIAGYNATHEPIVAFPRKTPLVIAFCEPNICSVGAKWNDLSSSDPAIGTAMFESGRARILQQEHGMIKIYADHADGRLLGAEMAAPQGEHLGHLLAWSITNRQTVFDLLSLPFYHPTVEETLKSALKDLMGNLKGQTVSPKQSVGF